MKSFDQPRKRAVHDVEDASRPPVCLLLLCEARDIGALRVTRTYHPVHNVGHLRFLECSAVGRAGEPEGDIALWKDAYFPYDPGLKERADLSDTRVEKRPELSGQEVVETYAYDSQGLIRVEIENRTAGYRRVFTLEPASSTG